MKTCQKKHSLLEKKNLLPTHPSKNELLVNKVKNNRFYIRYIKQKVCYIVKFQKTKFIIQIKYRYH